MWRNHLQPYSHSCSDGLKNQDGGIDDVCIFISVLKWPLDMGNKKKSHTARSNEYGGCARMSQPDLRQILDVTIVMRCHFVLKEEDATLQQLLLFWTESMSHIIEQYWSVVCVIEFKVELHGATLVRQGFRHEIHLFRSTLIIFCNFLCGDNGECHSALWRFISGS